MTTKSYTVLESPARLFGLLTLALTAALYPGSSAQAQSDTGPSLAEMHTHALAFNAILDSQAGFVHSSIGTSFDSATTEQNRPNVRKLLADYYGVTSREELLAMLDSFATGETGQRALYWEIYTKMTHYLPGSANNLYLEYGPKNGARVNVVMIYQLLPVGKALPIAAWDFARYILLCRDGYNAGWLSEDEAWAKIMPVARMLQASYSSWEDFAADYLRGREFWKPDDPVSNNRTRSVAGLLERKEGGLWSSIPWGQSLGSGDVQKDPLALLHLTDYKPHNWYLPQRDYFLDDAEFLRTSTLSDSK
jgi:Protein of unknown function (DUF1266)